MKTSQKEQHNRYYPTLPYDVGGFTLAGGGRKCVLSSSRLPADFSASDVARVLAWCGGCLKARLP